MKKVDTERHHASLFPTLLHDFRFRQQLNPDARIGQIKPIPVLPVTHRPPFDTKSKSIEVEFSVSTVFQNGQEMVKEFTRKLTERLSWVFRELSRVGAYDDHRLSFIEVDPESMISKIKSNGMSFTVGSLPFFEVPVTLVEYAAPNEIKFKIHFIIHIYKIEKT